MNYQLIGIVIKNLRKLDDYIVQEPVLIPKPKEISRLENNSAYILSSDSILSFINIKDNELFVNDINDFLREFTGMDPLKIDNPSDSDNKLLNEKSEWDLLDVNNPEGYNIEIINERILVYALHENGLFYGMQTILQLLKNALLSGGTSLKKKKLILPEIEIRDVPDLKIRGVAQDISRGQVFTIDNAKRYMKILSHYKMNFYCLYMEDMFAHPKHPLIGKGRGALTIEEIKDLDIFAKEHFIELVPIFECLGHVDNILAHEEYEHLGEFPGAQCLNISNPDIYSFLNDFISEISNAFSTEYFHIGCDESFDLGKGRSKEFIKEQGKGKALVDCYEKIYHLARENGNRHVIMYDDIVRINKEVQKTLEKDLILMYWNYSPKKKYPSLEKYIKAGFRVIVSPSMMNWQRNFPDNKNSSKNIINFTRKAYKYRNHGCLGVINSTWGDQRYYSLRENEIFGAVLSAAVSWTTPGFNYISFKKNFGFLFYGIEKEKLDSFNELYTLLSSSASYYYRGIKLLPPFFNTYFFKHPFSTKKLKPTFKKYAKLGDMAAKCLEIHGELKASVVFESENFEYIEFGAEIARFLKEKIGISLKISKLLKNPDFPRGALIKDLEGVKEKVQYLKDKYEKLWLRAAKRPGLDEILKLYDSLIKFYEDKISQLKNEKDFEDPYLKSEWIWARETSGPSAPRYFRKIIEINNDFEKAVIQGIASNQMKIYINGKYIGEVFSRLSLSALPIKNRVKVWDITSELKKGKNIIAIEAYNYEGFKGAINLYGEIKLKAAAITEEIFTDKTWLTNKKEIFDTDDWLKLDFDDSLWKPAKSYGRPPKLNGDIFAPNLMNGEISSTQDYFGMEGFFYNIIGSFASNFVAKLAKPFIPKVVKFLKPYGK